MNKLMYTIATITVGTGLAFAQAPETTKPETTVPTVETVPELPGIPEIATEFGGGMPAEVQAAVDAARAAADIKRQEFKGMTPDEVKAKVEELRAEAAAKRDAALQNLDEDRRAKVEAILEKIGTQDQARDGELRERLEAVEALKAAREKAAEESHESLDKSMDAVQSK